MVRAILVIAAIVLVSCQVTFAALVTRTESFTGSPVNWTGLNNATYGFRNTNNTGGASPAGEVGGTFNRTTVKTHYADTTLRNDFGLGAETFFDAFDAFQASGEVNVAASVSVNEFVGIGFFDSLETGPLANAFMGFQLEQGSPGNTILRSNAIQQGGSSTTLPNGTYTFLILYNPTFSGSDGRITTTLTNGVSTYTVFTDVVAGAKSGRSASTGGYLNIDAFGFVNGINNNDLTGQLEVYIDGLSYTGTPVPEPGSAVLALIGSVGILMLRRTRTA